ncbi:MAG: PAS domain S-box protein [Terasakiella sp.]|uniref:PAS domain S-box protein n=1 Tax=unclassified Terasakiella TaxID=2614952 RepID=UPI003AFF994B
MNENDNNNKGFRLSTFILALSFGGVLSVSALFGVSSYLSAQRLVDHEIRQSFDYRHRIVQLNLNEKLSQIAARLSLLSDLQPLIQAVGDSARSDVDNFLFDVMQSDEMRDLDVLIITNQQGAVIGDASSLLSPLSKLTGHIYQNAPRVFQKWSLVELDVSSQKMALVYSVPLIEGVYGQVIGAAYVAFALTENIQFSKRLMAAADVARLYLTNETRILVKAGSDPLGQDMDDTQVLSLAKKANNDIIKVGDYVGASQDINIGVNGGGKLNVITFMRRDTAVDLMQEYRMSGLLLIIGALITALCIAYMIRRLMRNSTLRLTAYVDQVNKGDRAARFQAGPVQEFNRLGDVVGNMVATIHENERYLTNLIDLAPSPIIVWDEQGRMTKFNRAAERMMGFVVDAGQTPDVQDIMAEISQSNELERKASILQRSLNGEMIEGWEMAHRNFKTAQINYISWSISPVAFHSDGSVATVLAQGLDITQRKRAEKELQRINEELERRVTNRTRALEDEIVERRHIETELRNSEERFRDIAEASSDWFWEMGPDLRFSYMSDKAMIVSGFMEEDIIGKTREELIGLTPEDCQQPKWRAHIETMERREPFRAFEYTLKNHHGDKRVFRISGKPVFNSLTGDFLGYRGSGRDVTEDYLRAQELQIAKEEAENASQAKSEFLSSMSHELRTPLNGILGFAQLLLMPKGNQLQDSQKEFINQILKAGNHLLNLINEILDLAKIEARKVEISLEPVNPYNVMEDVIDLLDGLAHDRGIQLINEITEDNTTMIYADFTRLKQVLVNLGGNAIKYNKERGLVRFTCKYDAGLDMVQFNVIDTGLGIDLKQKDELFVPFNRLNAEFSEIEGTGIGLAITDKLVGLMGGEMGVDSTPGEGSCFWFRLPVYKQVLSDGRKGGAAFQEIETINPVLRRTLKILYVEDNPSNSALMQDALTQSPNVELIIKRTAEEGLAYIETDEVDLLFLDINLPGMSGWDMMEILRQKQKFGDFPIIAVTAQAMRTDVVRAQTVGFADYLSKPINLKDVFDLIRKHTRVS